MPNIITGAVDTSNINQSRRTYDRRKKMKEYGKKSSMKKMPKAKISKMPKKMDMMGHMSVMKKVGAMI